MPKLARIFVAALLVTGCATITPTPQIIYVTPPPGAGSSPASSLEPSSSPSPSATPEAMASPAPTATPRITPAPATPTPTATRAPATPTPGSADVYLGEQKLIAWKPKYSSYVSYQVIVEVKNQGTGWAQIGAFQSDYAIYDDAGKVVTTGSFIYAYPEFLGPGETGYLIEESVQDGYAASDFATLEVNGRYGDADGPPPNQLVVSNTNLRPASFGGGLEVTGQVENIGTEPADSAHAAAVYFDAAGNIIGSSYTNLIENVDPGQKKAFETIDSNPLKRADVDSFTVIASAD